MRRLPYTLVALISILVSGVIACSAGVLSDNGAGDAGGDGVAGGDTTTGDPAGDAGGSGDPQVGGDPTATVTVNPTRINDVLINPGMGFTDFHFRWFCNLPPITFTPEQCAQRALDNWPANYPDSAIAYFRWHWAQIEPTRGQIDFDMIDTAMLSANLLGETFSFRIMPVDAGGQGVPDWLLAPPYSVAGASLPSEGGTTFWPDVRDASFQAEHERLVTALAARYDGHPALDHVDIGSVGCWGEWNTACLTDGAGIFEVYNPADDAERDEIAAAYESLIDHFFNAFSITPVVMLGQGGGGGRELEVMVHAMQGGAGWRVDCWGDWDLFGPGWSHHENAYPDMITNVTAAFSGFPDVWQHAPIQLEICGTFPDWLAAGYTTDAPDGEVAKSFQWALDQHASVLNGKSTDVPIEYLTAIDDLLRANGYRFVVDSFSHPASVALGGTIRFESTWSNIGVAPMYIRRDLVYRLTGLSHTETFTSTEDVRTWLPGTWNVSDSFPVPAGLPPGTYTLEVGLPDRAGTAPATPPLAPLFLSNEGRGTDGWYALSTVTVH